MKKRLLLIFVVGISFSPSVFAVDGVGEFKKHHGASIYCAAMADKGDLPDSGDTQVPKQDHKIVSGQTLSQNSVQPSN